MTPKEALKVIKHGGVGYTVEEYNEAYSVVYHSLDELEELKRYPTADEVCKALSEELEDNVWFKNNNFYTGYMNEIDTLASWYNGRVFIGFVWRPSLITLIGRFYEGLEKVGKK